MLAALDFKALQHLFDDKIENMVEVLEESRDIALGLDGKARQVDGGKRQVAAIGADFPGRVVDIGDNARPAAHISDLGLRRALIIL